MLYESIPFCFLICLVIEVWFKFIGKSKFFVKFKSFSLNTDFPWLYRNGESQSLATFSLQQISVELLIIL